MRSPRATGSTPGTATTEEPLEAATTQELRDLIRDDYHRRPVPRDDQG